MKLLMTIWMPANNLGQDPNKPYSGKMMLRVPPELHAAVASTAESHGKRINQWAADALERETNG